MGLEPCVRPGSPGSLLPYRCLKPVGPEEGWRARLLGIRAWWGPRRRLTEDGHGLARGPWLDNSGKRGQTRPLCPGLPESKTLVWVLKQKLRLEILQRIPLWWGGVGWEEAGKSMISYFSILDQIPFEVTGIDLQTELK